MVSMRNKKNFKLSSNTPPYLELCSLELSCQEDSYERSQHMFSLIIRKNIFANPQNPLLFGALGKSWVDVTFYSQWWFLSPGDGRGHELVPLRNPRIYIIRRIGTTYHTPSSGNRDNKHNFSYFPRQKKTFCDPSLEWSR